MKGTLRPEDQGGISKTMRFFQLRTNQLEDWPLACRVHVIADTHRKIVVFVSKIFILYLFITNNKKESLTSSYDLTATRTQLTGILYIEKIFFMCMMLCGQPRPKTNGQAVTFNKSRRTIFVAQFRDEPTLYLYHSRSTESIRGHRYRKFYSCEFLRSQNRGT